LRRPPGREAYPGDVFYLHSRLLERSAMLSEDVGSGSLTALPIAETIEGDISAYIVTNLISITDGQIFLDKSLLESGIKPAVHTTLSVSRIGASAQVKNFKKIIGSIKLLLADYRRLANFERFGASLDEDLLRLVNRGKLVVNFLNQGQHQPLML
jgi:F-type H+-transporting ATPase subunit alpha